MSESTAAKTQKEKQEERVPTGAVVKIVITYDPNEEEAKKNYRFTFVFSGKQGRVRAGEMGLRRSWPAWSTIQRRFHREVWFSFL